MTNISLLFALCPLPKSPLGQHENSDGGEAPRKIAISTEGGFDLQFSPAFNETTRLTSCSLPNALQLISKPENCELKQRQNHRQPDYFFVLKEIPEFSL